MPRRFLAGASAGLVAAASLLAARPSTQERPTFRSGADVIVIDVNVVDASHNPVGNLQAGDFTVTVDGRRRNVVSAHLVRYDVKTTPLGAQQPVTARAEVVEPDAAARPARNLILALDLDGIEAGDAIQARKAAEKFLECLAPEDQLAVVTLPTPSGDIRLTKDRDSVRQALAAAISGNERFRDVRYNIGLSEAFAVERGDRDLMERILSRECRSNDPFCREEVKMAVRQVQTLAHLRGRRSLDALRHLAQALQGIEGPKTMVLVSGGAPRPDVRAGYDYSTLAAAFAGGQVTLYTILVRPEQLGQVKNRVSPTFAEDAALEREGVENATSAAGGTFMEAIGTFGQYFDRVATELSAVYLLGVEVQPTDRDGKTHHVRVAVDRRGVEVRARKEYLIRPVVPVPPSPSVGAKVRVPLPVETAAAVPQQPSPGSEELRQILSRLVDYVADYRQRYSGIVAEEHYEQSTPTERVRLRSDLLLVQSPDDEGWVSFRDVFEVDGRRVRDREDRLQKLFLDSRTEAREQLKKIKEESARYNIGDVARNVNVPFFPLLFLEPGNVPRFGFKLAGRRTSEGVAVWQVNYDEQKRPTIVRTRDGRDVPAKGWFLVEPVSGAVVRSAVFYGDSNESGEIVAQYRLDRPLGMWVPAEMSETYREKSGLILLRGNAMYSRFRRFQVTTEEKIKIPK
jgi:VWFA-related protein